MFSKMFIIMRAEPGNEDIRPHPNHLPIRLQRMSGEGTLGIGTYFASIFFFRHSRALANWRSMKFSSAFCFRRFLGRLGNIAV